MHNQAETLFFLSSISSSSCILKDYILKKGSFYSLRDAGINKPTFSFHLSECHLKGISLNLPKGFFWGFPGAPVGKEPACNSGDSGLIPGSRRSPGEGGGNPLQYSCLGNAVDRGAWWATVHGVTRVDMT